MSDFLKIKQIEGLAAILAAKAQDADVVKKANALSDVNASQARTNLEVYSKAEVDSFIVGANNAFSVADMAALNGLSGLKVSDRIFVSDDGDNKWALYMVSAITDGLGSTSTFKKIADEDLFINALTAEAVKAAYESNPDTYAFTGSYKSKLDKISIAENLDLDALKLLAESALQDAATAQTTANSASASAFSAQTVAGNAATAAQAAQNTANNALSAASIAQATADSKKDAFSETVENFTDISAAGNVDVPLTLANAPKSGFQVSVYFNGMRVRQVSYVAGNPNISYNVPFETEQSDNISVVYSY